MFLLPVSVVIGIHSPRIFELGPEVIEELFEELRLRKERFFVLFVCLRPPLAGNNYQWIGMKLNEATKLKTEKNSRKL